MINNLHEVETVFFKRIFVLKKFIICVFQKLQNIPKFSSKFAKKKEFTHLADYLELNPQDCKIRKFRKLDQLLG